ncbi:hypothetical protein, partial [Saccharospirillum sp. MSK14-1]|uniref:hypothetical protein n=1 Tax=Saccharospirillum sp. MSK14-1 TaxID=1897632 RepID=UPI0011B1ED2D
MENRIIDVGKENNKLFNQQSFKFKHNLSTESELQLGELKKLILRLPEEQVYASSSKVKITANLDNAHKDHGINMALETAMDEFETSDSFVMVRSPEVDNKLSKVFGEVKAEIDQFAKLLRTDITDSTLYLFLASPKSITPYHIDRYSTFLFQLQGEKNVSTWAPWNKNMIDDVELEKFFAKSH